MIEYILAGVVLLGIIAIIVVIISNKLNFVLIKIDKADEDISLYLDRKYELLDRTRPIIKKELKIDNFLEDIKTYENVKEDSFTSHDLLKSNYNELFKTLDNNEKLFKSDSLTKILKELSENEENIVGAIKFYNDTVVDYNKLVVSFPSNIIALFRRCKKLEFYNNEKRERFGILKEK